LQSAESQKRGLRNGVLCCVAFTSLPGTDVFSLAGFCGQGNGREVIIATANLATIKSCSCCGLSKESRRKEVGRQRAYAGFWPSRSSKVCIEEHALYQRILCSACTSRWGPLDKSSRRCCRCIIPPDVKVLLFPEGSPEYAFQRVKP
jgi:hypothetical protein